MSSAEPSGNENRVRRKLAEEFSQSERALILTIALEYADTLAGAARGEERGMYSQGQSADTDPNVVNSYARLARLLSLAEGAYQQ